MGEKLIMRVLLNKTSGKKLVTIPKLSKINVGNYVKVKKVGGRKFVFCVVRFNKTSGQKLITIPRKSIIKSGNYVEIIKI